MMVPILFRCVLVEKGSISIPHPTWNGNNPLRSLSKSGGKYFSPVQFSFVNSDSVFTIDNPRIVLYSTSLSSQQGKISFFSR